MDHILFVPVADHPVKKSEVRLPLKHRLAMLELAIGDNPCFSISRVDIDREGPHYSADTITILREQYPQAELYFVMGGDNLRSLPTWKRGPATLPLLRLAVMKRADEDIAPDMHDEVLPGLSGKVDIVDVPMLSVWLSSTYVVSRLRANLSVRYLVPDKVPGIYRCQKSISLIDHDTFRSSISRANIGVIGAGARACAYPHCSDPGAPQRQSNGRFVNGLLRSGYHRLR